RRLRIAVLEEPAHGCQELVDDDVARRMHAGAGHVLDHRRPARVGVQRLADVLELAGAQHLEEVADDLLVLFCGCHGNPSAGVPETVLTFAGAVSRKKKLSRPPPSAHNIMTSMCATTDVWSANQPEIVGDNTPPTISPAATTRPIDDAASVLGTVSDGITPMNTANEPDA